MADLSVLRGRLQKTITPLVFEFTLLHYPKATNLLGDFLSISFNNDGSAKQAAENPISG